PSTAASLHGFSWALALHVSPSRKGNRNYKGTAQVQAGTPYLPRTLSASVQVQAPLHLVWPFQKIATWENSDKASSTGTSLLRAPYSSPPSSAQQLSQLSQKPIDEKVEIP